MKEKNIKIKRNKKNKTTAIIQARMTSTRLPGKVLMDIEGKPMLWRVINRLRFSKKIDDIILAIPDTKENDILEEFIKKNNIKYFRGSEKDVLSRYYEAAKKNKCNTIARITSDCPLIDPKIVDSVIKKYLNSSADYTSNTLKRTFPRGLDIEVFNFKVLEKAYKEAKQFYQREHVTPYIYENPEKFRLINVKNKSNLCFMRWTVDEKKDLEFVREIYKKIYPKKKIFYMKDIVAILRKYPKLMKINEKVRQKNEK